MFKCVSSCSVDVVVFSGGSGNGVAVAVVRPVVGDANVVVAAAVFDAVVFVLPYRWQP